MNKKLRKVGKVDVLVVFFFFFKVQEKNIKHYLK